MNDKTPSRIYDIDIFSSDCLEQKREEDKNSLDYNLLTKSQKRFVDKQLMEIRKTQQKSRGRITSRKTTTRQV